MTRYAATDFTAHAYRRHGLRAEKERDGMAQRCAAWQNRLAFEPPRDAPVRACEARCCVTFRTIRPPASACREAHAMFYSIMLRPEQRRVMSRLRASQRVAFSPGRYVAQC